MSDSVMATYSPSTSNHPIDALQSEQKHSQPINPIPNTKEQKATNKREKGSDGDKQQQQQQQYDNEDDLFIDCTTTTTVSHPTNESLAKTESNQQKNNSIHNTTNELITNSSAIMTGMPLDSSYNQHIVPTVSPPLSKEKTKTARSTSLNPHSMSSSSSSLVASNNGIPSAAASAVARARRRSSLLSSASASTSASSINRHSVGMRGEGGKRTKSFGSAVQSQSISAGHSMNTMLRESSFIGTNNGMDMRMMPSNNTSYSHTMTSKRKTSKATTLMPNSNGTFYSESDDEYEYYDDEQEQCPMSQSSLMTSNALKSNAMTSNSMASNVMASNGMS